MRILTFVNYAFQNGDAHPRQHLVLPLALPLGLDDPYPFLSPLPIKILPRLRLLLERNVQLVGGQIIKEKAQKNALSTVKKHHQKN